MEELHPSPRRRSQEVIQANNFRRTRFDEIAKVVSFEYDPNRTANIALLEFDGENHILHQQI